MLNKYYTVTKKVKVNNVSMSDKEETAWKAHDDGVATSECGNRPNDT